MAESCDINHEDAASEARHVSRQDEPAGEPLLVVEHVAATLQQKERMAEGLRILAAWLLRRHRRLQTPPAASENRPEALDFAATSCPPVRQEVRKRYEALAGGEEVKSP